MTMQLTKFGHSCVRIADGDRRLVLDPGGFSQVDAALDGVDEVLITHEHADHIDVERVAAAAKRNPRLRIWAPAPVAALLPQMQDQIVVVAPGQEHEVAGFAVRTFGGQHALIHPSIPVIANVGFLLDEAVYHPGDSLFVPPVPVRTLLLPMHAPWNNGADVIDFAISVRAPVVHQIHDGLLQNAGISLIEGLILRVAGPHGVDFRRLGDGDSVTS
jgi:L-ascorbate metabolism protein UlaG (beta-lactamase superfamily)